MSEPEGPPDRSAEPVDDAGVVAFYLRVIDFLQRAGIPFLGSSRLEEPLNRYAVTAAFHGHAHHGQPEGRTSQGVPVYNVSLPLLTALRPDGPPFRLLELEVA